MTMTKEDAGLLFFWIGAIVGFFVGEIPLHEREGDWKIPVVFAVGSVAAYYFARWWNNRK